MASAWSRCGASTMGTRKGRILAIVVAAAVLVAAVPALVQLGWLLRLFAGRASYPLDLEWMEGGTLVHAQRIAAGQGIYVPPSVDFIPFLYTPLYPALLAALSFVFPLGYTLGRVVSILAFAAALGAIVVAAVGEAAGRQRKALAALAGLGGAGVVAASFAFTGNFYDLVRSDSLLLALEAWAVLLAVRGQGRKSALGAGLLIALGFLSKQTATIVGVGLGVGLLVASLRRGLLYGAAAAASLAAGIGLLLATSRGWFWTYIFKLHQSHGYRWDTVRDVAWPLLVQFLWPLFFVLVLATLGLALARKLRRCDVVLWAVALAGASAALVGFATQWADSNAFIPAVFFPAFAAAVLVARLCLLAVDGKRWIPAAAAVVAVLVLGAQSLHTLPPTPARVPKGPWPVLLGWPKLARALPAAGSAVPSAQDRAAALRLLDELRALPGPLFIPFHTYYGVLAGKQPFVHRMGVRDVEAALGRPKGLDQAIAERRFAAIVLDWKSYPGEWPNLDLHYQVARELYEGTNSVRMFAGAQTSPNRLYLPKP
jgi:hypothetical protein